MLKLKQTIFVTSPFQMTNNKNATKNMIDIKAWHILLRYKYYQKPLEEGSIKFQQPEEMQLVYIQTVTTVSRVDQDMPPTWQNS